MNIFPEQVFTFNSDVVKSIRAERPSVLDEKRFELGHRHLNEEAEEFLFASQTGDVVKAVDAIIDSMYIGMGILYKMGLTVQQIEDCISAVHNCNMQKQRGTVVRNGVAHNEDAIKPEGWTPPERMIKKILGLASEEAA